MVCDVAWVGWLSVVSEGKVLELAFLVADLKPDTGHGFERADLRPSLFVVVMNTLVAGGSGGDGHGAYSAQCSAPLHTYGTAFDYLW